VARGSQIAGDTTKASKAFQDLFALWKDAEQDLPVLIQAKKDYAALPTREQGATHPVP
jgi:eukaryotic-like serine/threonine-protein kinase